MPRIRQFIDTFPSSIDRQYFGAWLSGFVDGEGCFGLYISRSKRTVTPYARFSVGLRADDSPILILIRSYLSCGIIQYNQSKPNTNPITNFIVEDIHSLMNVVIPQFDTFPLLAKKSNDFFTWKKAVQVIYEVTSRPTVSLGNGCGRLSKWSDDDLVRFYDIQDALAQERVYRHIPQ